MAPAATTLLAESEGNASLGALGKTVSGKKLNIRSYPTFETLEEERLYRKQHLAAAFRLFAFHPARKLKPLLKPPTASQTADSTRASQDTSPCETRSSQTTSG